MKKTNKQLEVKFESLEPSKKYVGMDRCKILVGYADDNRNRTNIKKEVWDDANANSIKNIPIVGIYSQEDGRFKGHMDIDFDDDGLVITNPVPYGVVPESASIYWETIEEEDGSMRDYVVVDGALLWTKRYPEVKEAFENGTVGQSMEILVNDYEVDERGFTIIKEMEYSSLCLLGLSEPCFESAKATMFTLDKDKFKQEFNLLLNEIKNTNIEEVEILPNKNKEIEEVVEPVVEDENEEVTEVPEVAVNEENTVDTDKNKANIDEAVEDKFELSYRNKIEKIETMLQKHYDADEYTWIYICDMYDEFVIFTVDSSGTDRKYYKVNYNFDNNEAVVNFDEVLEVESYWKVIEKSNDLEDKFNKASETIANLESEKSTFETKLLELEKSNNELYSFKEDILEKQRICDINSIESKFSKKLAINEIKSIKDKTLSKEISVEQMETELCRIFTNKSFELSEKEVVEKPAVQVFSVKTESNKCPYQGLEHLFTNK